MRSRLLLLVSVLVVAGAVWYASSQQRQAVATGDAKTQTASDLLTGMLNQEVGLRGYLLTSQRSFLAPYTAGRQQVEQALARVAAFTAPSREERATRAVQAAAVRAWEAAAERQIAISRIGANTSMSEQAALKDMFDRFRRANAKYHDDQAAQRDASLSRAGTELIVLIVTLASLFGGIGSVLLERSRRRGARARERDIADQRKQAQFTELLQVTRTEHEAHALLKRHLERSVPGSEVAVLNRNNSANRLEAATPLVPDTLFAERLAGAKPEDCLAIRIGRSHERTAASAAEELLSCELCGAYGKRTTCLPSLVGGEVTGSVLIALPARLNEQQARQVDLSVTQAAPVLANLRTLSIAEAQATTDSLTGLSNARALQDSVKRLVAQALRTGEPLAAVALDLDHFKDINDRHGHEAGDNVLAAIGETVTSSMRGPEDFGGRAGGEEFLALLPNTDRAGALAYAERLRGVIAALSITAVDRKVTASIGVAVLPDDAITDKDLLRRADRALYMAKSKGRNRVESAEQPTPRRPDDTVLTPTLAA